MCEPVTIMMIASTALTAYGQMEQGKQQKEWADYQAAQSEADARAEKSAAEVEANKIRKMGQITASEATASLAGSGVKIDEGSSVDIRKNIVGNAEQDAVMTVFGGADRSARLNSQAQADRIRGNQAETAGAINAGSTVLGAAGSYARGGWKTKG